MVKNGLLHTNFGNVQIKNLNSQNPNHRKNLNLLFRLLATFKIEGIKVINSMIGEDEMKCLTKELKNNQSIKSFQLEQNHYANESAQNVLVDYITGAPNLALTKFVLKDRNFSDDGVRAIGKTLLENENLKTLMLPSSFLNDETARILIKAIKTHLLLNKVYFVFGDRRVELSPEVEQEFKDAIWVRRYVVSGINGKASKLEIDNILSETDERKPAFLPPNIELEADEIIKGIRAKNMVMQAGHSEQSLSATKEEKAGVPGKSPGRIKALMLRLEEVLLNLYH